MWGIDFETRSAANINLGSSFYSKHKTTEALCLAWIEADGKTTGLWQKGEPAPTRLMDYVKSGGKISAWNCNFEWCMWNNVMHPRFDWPKLDIHNCYCSAAAAAALAIPRSLGKAAVFLGLDVQKDAEGKKLMQKMCKPRDAENGTLFDLCDENGLQWHEKPADLRRLAEYCTQDVVVERAILDSILPLSESEQRVWWYDQQINDRGVLADLELAQAALDLWTPISQSLDEQAKWITDGISLGQVAELSKWIHKNGVKMHKLDREAIEKKLLEGVENPDVRLILQLRLEYSQAAIAKFKSILSSTEEDGRLRGMLLYHGARTGRWSGKRVQPQNLPRGCVKAKWTDTCVELVKAHDLKAIRAVFDSPGEMIGSMVRPTLIAPPGHKLIACDFAAIEARAIAWAARQEDMLEAFRNKQDSYKIMASDIYDKPVEEINSAERFIGKSAVLGCFGYRTKVLTSSGWKNIVDVKTSDLLWDGVEWVSHQGVVYQGEQECIEAFSVNATPDHLFLLKSGWSKWENVAANRQSLRAATELVNLPSDSPLGNRTSETEETLLSCKDASKSLKSVYDIAHAGPRNRFTILTSEGPVLVHNCGYGLGPKKFRDQLSKFGVDVTVDFANLVVKKYRTKNYRIQQFWWSLNDAALTAIREPGNKTKCGPFRFVVEGEWLFAILPSGRRLAYFKPSICKSRWGDEGIDFQGTDQAGNPCREETYGGKLAENVISGHCRDILVVAMKRLEEANYPVIFSVHDEVITEVPEDFGSVAEVEQIMEIVPSFSTGLPIAVEGFSGKRYRK